jgi:hypothetical protein
MQLVPWNIRWSIHDGLMGTRMFQEGQRNNSCCSKWCFVWPSSSQRGEKQSNYSLLIMSYTIDSARRLHFFYLTWDQLLLGLDYDNCAQDQNWFRFSFENGNKVHSLLVPEHSFWSMIILGEDTCDITQTTRT